ncbi:bifunctional adenosine 5'-phosphosulfate phosphorylase/adenylylsulfatase HINT4 isoform X1 [Oryza sativa Japonica Group]|jgi:diadenosine tetraphosphate (Ap4A) HIT family hydrolase|uniref:Os04g0535400 protein n=4 Tax=Oryza sativa TaxID=4530 RepID=B9FGC4_ORYSJ|nr:bifunctional adenosine 5'-phosphosulfate phosphorylase/adenylylsulfatase HINT4 isoform X3 [Oryza sativa Japonica Group]XP_015633547.1 bifunctional adenosine 5'-phosphosulfate phosphorylase/adenylylsulfatase HINT4 isoform X3 [Oryza sativa Japonica Group]XP_015633549.1 bifunctional adenosine 5'-phosphosulfate phosphorylase/adenylylsulfatase HINT4 isoform X3 [Oryza sativa Japonica Group]XP_025880828.1 bifunctional adenosine 5'-phosphosulfate phosphorylase/adenylylsulfatase HINT4 isoform X3 [Oryz|eukprot:NP_001053421.1 Os04g0535400 [Oryza sativa Japonica Group]
MKKLFCFRGGTVARRSERAPMAEWCVFCPIARRDPACNTVLLYSDDRVMAFKDINPSAFRHYLVIPIEHIPTVNNLQRTTEDHQLVSHMLAVGRDLLNRDAPNSEEQRFGFHQPPFNSVDHLHLHCLALPFTPSWRQVKYTPLGPLGGFIEAESLLERIRP